MDYIVCMYSINSMFYIYSKIPGEFMKKSPGNGETIFPKLPGESGTGKPGDCTLILHTRTLCT